MYSKDLNGCSGCRQCQRFDVSIFNELNKISLEDLDSMKKIVSYEKGSVIFREGTTPKGLYCIRSGKIKMTQIGADGQDLIVKMLRSGDILGHIAIFSHDYSSSSAHALEDTQLCFFPGNAFYNFVEKNGKLILRFVQLLANELKSAERKITSSVQQSVLARVSGCLLFLYEKYGYENNSTVLNINITREELADFAGTTRESATRALYRLKDLGIVDVSGRKIKILNNKQLIASALSR